MKSFERKTSAPNERTTQQEHARAQETVQAATADLVEHYRQVGVRLDRNGRIHPSAFRDSRAPEDMRRHEHYVRSRQEDMREKGEKTAAESELFEHLVPIIFTKMVPERVVAVRSSLYDDLKNGIDTVIVNRENGDVVCSVDEVVFGNKRTLHNKEQQILSINGGYARLEYGYKKQDDGSFMPTDRSAGDFPLCSLSIPGNMVFTIIEQMKGNLTDVSVLEKRAFDYFIRNMCMSLTRIYLGEKDRPPHHDRYEALARKTDERFMTGIRGTITFLKSLRSTQKSA